MEGRDRVLSVLRDDDRLRLPRDVPRALIYNTAHVHLAPCYKTTGLQFLDQKKGV